MKTLLTYWDPEVLKKFRIRCAEDGVKMAAKIRELVKEFLKKGN